MFKRVLLALTLAASLGGVVLACNSPAATSKPASLAPLASSPAASDMLSPEPLMSASPSAS